MIDTTHVQESEIKVIKLILAHKKCQIWMLDDSSDISDEEKELCSTLLCLQPNQFEPGSESESEVNNDINKESTAKHLEARVVNCNWCECGKCSGIEEREVDCLCGREVTATDDEKFTG